MKKSIMVLLMLNAMHIAEAQNKTILITESSLPYTNQAWFYSGIGNSLQESKIKSNWDEGRMITSAGYTSNGWFVTMAKGTGIDMQTYYITSDWPKDWISKKWDDDYYITSISRGENQWLVVMSKGAGFTTQIWNRTDWNSMSKWIKEKWDAGYYITSSCYNGTYWTVVMSKHSKFSSQGYLWASNYNVLKSKIRSTVYDKGYNVQIIEYGGGEYFVVYCKYKENNGRSQHWNVNPSDVSSYIQERWNESQNIAYIGSDYSNQPSYAFSQQRPNNSATSKSGSTSQRGTITYDAIDYTGRSEPSFSKNEKLEKEIITNFFSHNKKYKLLLMTTTVGNAKYKTGEADFVVSNNTFWAQMNGSELTKRNTIIPNLQKIETSEGVMMYAYRTSNGWYVTVQNLGVTNINLVKTFIVTQYYYDNRKYIPQITYTIEAYDN